MSPCAVDLRLRSLGAGDLPKRRWLFLGRAVYSCLRRLSNEMHRLINEMTTSLLWATAIIFCVYTPSVHLQCTGAPNPQSTPVPLANFRDTSPWGGSDWVLQSPNSVIQRTNGQPTGFMSDFDGSLGQVVKGTIRVEDVSDDDFMGFIFGLDCNPPAPAIVTSCAGPGVLFDWKRGNQPNGGGPGLAGTAVSTFTSWGTANALNYWGKVDTVTQVVRGNNFGFTGWVPNQDYDFVAAYTRTRLLVYIDNVLEFDVSGTFPLGRNGFYGYSQQNTVYSDIEIVEAIGTHQCAIAPVRYTLDFTHAGGCTADRFSLEVIWDTLDMSEGITIYSTPTTFDSSSGTFDISNVYDNEGAHTFRMQLLRDDVAIGAPVDDFALVRAPVQAGISLTPHANCGFSSRCDAPTAEVSLLTQGGAPGYSAIWSDGDTTCCVGGSCSACDTPRFLGPGTYSATILDSQGCSDATSSVTVTTSSVSVTITEPSCGNMAALVTGNCSGYTYNWSTLDGCSSCLVPTATSQSGVTAGTYMVTVTDPNGCTATTSHSPAYQFTEPAVDEVVFMYVPFTWQWTGFQPGTTGTIYVEHDVSLRRMDLFTGDVSATQSVESSLFNMEVGDVTLRFEGTGTATCVVERHFYLCASPHTLDPKCNRYPL